MAKKTTINISSPILYVAIGILLMIFKAEMLSWVMTIAGVFFVAMGALDLIGKRTKSGVFNIALGAIILIAGWTILDIVLIIFGILIAARGVMDLVEILNSKKRNALSVVVAALTIALGVALALGDILGNIMWVIGLLLVIDGALGLLGAVKK